MVTAIEVISGQSKRRNQVLSLRRDRSVSEAAQAMTQSRVGSLLVVDDGKEPCGIITERDILDKVVAAGLDPARTFIQDVMTGAVICCAPDTSAEEAMRIMAAHEIRHLPVIENGVPVGMISSRDIMAHRLQTFEVTVRKQSRILYQLEKEYPGITQLEKDNHGRIVI